MSMKEKMRLVLGFLILISLFSFSYAHTSDKEDSTSSTILPFHYFSEGSYIQGVLILIFWILILKGLYELTMLILAKAIK